MKLLHPALLHLIVVSLLLVSCKAESAEKTGENTSAQNTPDKDSIAANEGFFADYESTNRVIWQKPDLVIGFLGDLQDKTVADIGAGTGHFSKRLVKKAKKVIAVDIDERFVHFLDSIRVNELEATESSRLEPRLALPDNPKLGPGEVDAVLIVNTFMYIENRVHYLEKLKEALTEGGKILIIDFKKIRTPIGPPLEVRLPVDSVVNDLTMAGYQNIEANNGTLQYQYIVLAQK